MIGAPPTEANLLHTLERWATEVLAARGMTQPYSEAELEVFDQVRVEGLRRWRVEHGDDPDWFVGLTVVESAYRLLGVIGEEGRAGG